MDISSSGVAIHVDLTAGMTMSDVAAAINAKNGAITATTANGQLRLTAKQTGFDSAITVVECHRRRLGHRPRLGGRRRRRLRHDRRQRVHELLEPGETAISGVTMNLTSATGPTGVSLTVNPSQVDNASIVARCRTFVAAYNDVIKTATTS